MDKARQFCALPRDQVDSGDMFFYGTGSTPYEAFIDFKDRSFFQDYCEYLTAVSGSFVQVELYSACTEERKLRLVEKIFTVHVKVPDFGGKL